MTQYEALKRTPLLDLAYEVIEKRILVHYEALHSRIDEIGGAAWTALSTYDRNVVRSALDVNLEPKQLGLL